jgi:hypothetical protein
MSDARVCVVSLHAQANYEWMAAQVANIDYSHPQPDFQWQYWVRLLPLLASPRFHSASARCVGSISFRCVIMSVLLLHRASRLPRAVFPPDTWPHRVGIRVLSWTQAQVGLVVAQVQGMVAGYNANVNNRGNWPDMTAAQMHFLQSTGVSSVRGPGLPADDSTVHGVQTCLSLTSAR